MAVVNLKSDVVTTITTQPATDGVTTKLSKGDVHNSISVLDAVLGNSSTSTYKLIELPSNARIMEGSFVDWASVLGCTDYDVGIQHKTLGTGADGYQDVDAFIASGAKTAGSPEKDTLFAVGDAAAKRQKRLWEFTAATTDPGGLYYVLLTLNADITGASGEINADIRYII